MKAAELRKQDRESLRKSLIEARRELLTLRVQRATNQLARPDRFQQLRRDVARIKTILRQTDKDSA